MARTYLIFGDIEGKLDVLRVECAKCDRKGRYHVAQGQQVEVDHDSRDSIRHDHLTQVVQRLHRPRDESFAPCHPMHRRVRRGRGVLLGRSPQTVVLILPAVALGDSIPAAGSVI